MAKVLIIHGAGMDMRGKTQIEVFGHMTLPEYDEHIRRYATELGLEVDIFQSNTEEAVITRLSQAEGQVDAAAINPAGFMRGHPALVAAIGRVGFPTIEVHISNPTRRGIVSEVAPACHGVVTGFGVFGY